MDNGLPIVVFELGRHGVRRILLLAAFPADPILEYATATPLKARFGLEIAVSVVPQRAGSGGAVWHARDHLEEPFLLLNGTSWFDINLLELANFIAREPSAAAVIALRRGAGPSTSEPVAIERDLDAGFGAAQSLGSGPSIGGVYLCRRAFVDFLRDLRPVDEFLGSGSKSKQVREDATGTFGKELLNFLLIGE